MDTSSTSLGPFISRNLWRKIRFSTIGGIVIVLGCDPEVTIEPHKPTPDVARVVDISSAASRTCALRSDGTVVCWGKPFQGLTNLPLDEVTQISVGSDRLCAITKERRVVCIKLPYSDNEPIGEPGLVSGLDEVTQVSVSGAHACALRATGELYCWGDNTFGQLGDGTYTTTNDPVLAKLDGVLSVSAGEFQTCVIAGNGGFCWGRALDGQLGDGSTNHEVCNGIVNETCSVTPVAIQGLSNPKHVAAGLNGACAVDETGRAFCWGWHSEITGSGASPIAVEIPGIGEVNQVFAGYTRGCAYTSSGGARCWGDGSTGALGDGTTNSPTAPVNVQLDNILRITGGWYHGCALRFDGVVFCWGDNQFQQLGIGSSSGVFPTPGIVPL